MRIAYFARIDLGQPSGVLKKIIRQISCWQEAGHTVKLFALSREYPDICADAKAIDLDVWETSSLIDLMWKSNRAIQGISDWQPDLVFWRYSSVYPKIRSKILDRFVTVMDVNSNYDLEYKQIHHPLAALFHRVTKPIGFLNVAGFTTLTHELEHWLGEYEAPVAVIGDGIDLQSIRPLPISENARPTLVCFASRNFPWISLDKIIELARSFPEWEFNLIGLTRDADGLGDAPDNVIFHGFLSRSAYEGVLARSDVALGTLGLHRIGLQEMAPLKLREYLAYGLPAIIGYKDTDFTGDEPYLLSLPNTEDNLACNHEMIEAFMSRWRGERVSREKIGQIDIAIKEQKRLAFFDRLVAKRRVE